MIKLLLRTFLFLFIFFARRPGLDFTLLMVEETDHVVLEWIAALIVAEALLMPRVDGLHCLYPCSYDKTFVGVPKRSDCSVDAEIDTAVHGEPTRVPQT